MQVDIGFLVWEKAPNPLGTAHLRCVHFSAKAYAKTKELGDGAGGAGWGGGSAWRALDPPMKYISNKILSCVM